MLVYKTIHIILTPAFECLWHLVTRTSNFRWPSVNIVVTQTSLTCMLERVASDKCAGAALRADWHQPEISLHSDSSEYSLSEETGPGQPGHIERDTLTKTIILLTGANACKWFLFYFQMICC